MENGLRQFPKWQTTVGIDLHKLQNVLKGSFFGHIHFFSLMASFESFRKLVAAKLYPFSMDPRNYLRKAAEISGLVLVSQIGQCLCFLSFYLMIRHKVKTIMYFKKDLRNAS